MLKKASFYYFSPTGGTKKAGLAFANAAAESLQIVDLNERITALPQAEGELTIVAAPVFGGRIPALVTEKPKTLSGNGGKAVVLAVYGNRDYEDALLEMHDTMTEQGFAVIAGAALLAQHSVVPTIAAARPDAQDAEKIAAFAAQVLAKLEANGGTVTVPGNRPYKDAMTTPFAPVTADTCIGCGACAANCPVEAITMEDGRSKANAEPCILCMGCTAICPVGAIRLPEPIQQAMNEKLSAFTARREPEFYL